MVIQGVSVQLLNDQVEVFSVKYSNSIWIWNNAKKRTFLRINLCYEILLLYTVLRYYRI